MTIKELLEKNKNITIEHPGDKIVGERIIQLEEPKYGAQPIFKNNNVRLLWGREERLKRGKD